MERSEIIDILRRHDLQLNDVGATHMYLYGSRARADGRADSDVDLFIDYDPSIQIPSLVKLIALKALASVARGAFGASRSSARRRSLGVGIASAAVAQFGTSASRARRSSR